MASGTIFAGSKLRENHRWGDATKVYSRRKLKNDSASTSATVNAANSLQHHQTPSPVKFVSEDSSNHNPPSEVPITNGNRGPLISRVKNRVRVSLENVFPKDDVRVLRRKLSCELDQVRNLVKQIEAKEIEVTELSIVSAAVERDSTPSRLLNVSVVENNCLVNGFVEKEKRTPKANQYYNSEFLLGKDRLPSKRNNKKSKSSSRGKKHSKQKRLGLINSEHTNQALKSCNSLIAKLLKHKYGWVFEKPVDVKALGLQDYHDIIKHPMDLGTIKNKLARNLYKSPLEFAEDVRLTFSNAMTYNPKGQDVHVMADELLKIFEESYADLEVLLWRHSRKVQPMRTLNRSESILKRSASIGRAPAPKRPKAKDPNKRDMTYEEKQKLSTKLQELPVDKLDGVVQIIKKRNTQLSQHGDEIEVDIDAVDAETLWELDRFVTNYKKTLSKYRRRDELAVQAKAVDITADPARASIGAVATTAEETITAGSGAVAPQGDNVSSSSSSSSDSSSSRDSDSDSSSDASDAELKLT